MSKIFRIKLKLDCLIAVFQRCDLCGKIGATVGCNTKGCKSNYHFMCARKDWCLLQEDKKVFCYMHRFHVDGDVSSKYFWGKRAADCTKTLMQLFYYSPSKDYMGGGILFWRCPSVKVFPSDVLPPITLFCPDTYLCNGFLEFIDILQECAVAYEDGSHQVWLHCTNWK